MSPIELSEQEAQFTLQAIDQFVRQTGLANAALGLCVAFKLQAAIKESAPQEDSVDPE